MVLSSDLITSIETMRTELNEIAEGRVDIIIGTQLVAKGHNFPRLNLVGVVDADLGLRQWRSARRRADVPVAQSGNRARGARSGPRGRLSANPPARTSRDEGTGGMRPRGVLCQRDRGARTHRLSRRSGRLASLIISAGDRPTAESFARRLAAIAPIDERIQVLGPAEAPLAVIKGRYRFRLLVKSLRNVDLSEYLREWLAAGPRPKAISSSRSTSIRRAFCSEARHSGAMRSIEPGISRFPDVQLHI